MTDVQILAYIIEKEGGFSVNLYYSVLGQFEVKNQMILKDLYQSFKLKE